MENTQSPYMPQGPAADFLGLSPRTLERFRVEGRGPSFLKLGRRVVYSREDLVTWAEAQRRRSTSEPGSTLGRAGA
jgi:Helix-turn-helix domain